MITLDKVKKIFKFELLTDCIQRIELKNNCAKIWLVFPALDEYRGFYKDALHGGITRMLFDVMTVLTVNLNGFNGPTCQGEWKLRGSIPLEKEVCIEGRLDKVKLGFAFVSIKVSQGGLLCAEACEAIKIMT